MNSISKQTNSESFVTVQRTACAVVLMLTVFAMLLVYPCRVFREMKTYEGSGAVNEMTGVVDESHDAGAYLTAKYDRIASAEIYISSVEEGERLVAYLYETTEDQWYNRIAEERVYFPEGGEGFVTIPLDAAVEPGSTLILMLNSIDNSRFTVGLEQIGDQEEMQLNSSFYQDSFIENEVLCMHLTYDCPVGKKTSVFLMGVILLIGCLLTAGIRLFFKKHPEKDKRIGLVPALQAVSTPVILAAFAAGLSSVLLHVFDRRLPDIIMYSAGMIILCVLFLVFLWKWLPLASLPARPDEMMVRHILIAVFLAAAFQACCSYTNAVYELQHTLARRQMFIFLFLMLLATFKVKELSEKKNLIYLAAAVFAGFLYYRSEVLLPEEPYAAQENQALLRLIICMILLGFVLLRTCMALLRHVRECGAGRSGFPGLIRWQLAAPLLVMFLLFALFWNSKTWVLWLVGFYLLFYARFALWEERVYWLRDLTWGMALQFMYMVLYCLYHRYYLSYLYTRFSMNFMTATVTAVYLSMMEAAALSVLLIHWKRQEGKNMKERLLLCFPYLVWFCTVASYLIMTLSRTGILTTFAISVVLVLIVFGRELLRKLPVFLLVIVLCTAVMFPAVFTAQRIVPSLFQDPVTYGEEQMPDLTLRNHRVNAAYYMCVERFAQLFGSRILGFEDDWITYDDLIREQYGDGPDPDTDDTETEAVFEEPGIPGISLPVRAAETDDVQAGDISNGRAEIYRIYLERLNMTGHEAMGVTLEDGSLIVHAHNVYLQAAYDFGIPTGIVFALFILLTFVSGALYYKNSRGNIPGQIKYEGSAEYTLLPVSILTAFAAAGMVEWVFQVCNLATVLLFLSIAPLLIRPRRQ